MYLYLVEINQEYESSYQKLILDKGQSILVLANLVTTGGQSASQR